MREQSALEGIGPKVVKVTGEWRKLHNEEFHGFKFSSNRPTIVIKRRKIIWEELEAHLTDTTKT